MKPAFLCIGDYITLKAVTYDGYLSTDGILVDDVVVNDDSNSFDDNIFCIHLMRQYTAAMDLDEFLMKNPSEKDMDEKSASFLKALKVSIDVSTNVNRKLNFFILYFVSCS